MRLRDGRQHEGGDVRPAVPRAARWPLALAAAAWLLAWAALPAAAAHYAQEGLGCYSCHTLDAAESEPGTSLISKSARSMILPMKRANGGAIPAQFGCIYCHDIGSRGRMRPVLAHFDGKASIHPVGMDFVSDASPEVANTDHEFLSSWDTAFPNELDCVDCHDVEGLGDGRDDPATPPDEGADGDPATSLLSEEFGSKYPEHGPPAYAANPFMLRNVTALDQYDPLCRTCHGSSAPLVKGSNNVRLDPARSHADGVAAGSGGSGPIIEDDGTPFKTTAGGGNDQCRSCHDTHYSNRPRLFNDGHERVGGTGAPETPIDAMSNCTLTCHYPGDAEGYAGEGPGQNTYTRSGHGMPVSWRGEPLALGCWSCHTVNERHESPYTDARAARMLATAPDPTASSFGTSARSICTTCHRTKFAHNPAGASAGCLDCHDEHAEGAGADGNARMIPRQLPNRRSGATELVTFAHAAPPAEHFDFFIENDLEPHVAGAGVCDNAVCHAGLHSADNTPAAPLNTLMTGDHHGGGSQPPLSDCRVCHLHESVGGSFGAQ